MRKIAIISVVFLAIPVIAVATGSIFDIKTGEFMSIDELLSNFGEAIPSADSERMQHLFLTPDSTDDGKNREAIVNEFRKDWADRNNGPPVTLRPKSAVVYIEMDDLDPDGPPGGRTSTIELKLEHTEHGWQIAAMR